MARAVYHVVAGGDGWQVKKVRGGVEKTFGTKADAIAHARKLAQRASLGQVVVHTKVGAIEREYTYGEDPRRSPG